MAPFDAFLQPELERLLAEDVHAARLRERGAFDRLVFPFGRSLVLFGAGNLGRKVLAELRREGIEPLAFADNDPARWGERVAGVAVLPPIEAAERFGTSAAFVVTIWSPGSRHRFGETRRFLHALGCVRVVSFLPFLWKHAESFLPDTFLDLPHRTLAEREVVLAASRHWEDEESRRTYLTQLQWRLLDDFDQLPPSSAGPQYFPPGLFSLSDSEVFLDAGSYDGDTLEQFLSLTRGRFGSFTGFEPDPWNFGKLAASVASLACRDRISLHQAALGERKGRLRLEATGTASSILVPEGGLEVECLCLDEVAAGMEPTFIKMDIEGAELSALEGARGTIVRTRPILAICVYHRPDHLWRIPSWIHGLVPEYRLHLRAHQEEGWDVVCYAVPPGRT